MNDNNPPEEGSWDPSQVVMPAHFAGPHSMPVHVDCSGAYDERGVWWVILRIETVHGSFITFLTPDSAKSIEKDLAAARVAQLTTPFVPNPTVPGIN